MLAYVRQYRGRGHPLRRQPVALGAGDRTRSFAWKDRIPLEMLGRTRFPAIGELPYMSRSRLTASTGSSCRSATSRQPVVPRAVPEFETLVVPVGATWVSLARERGVFERDVLPGHLARTRWFPERSATAIQPTLDLGDSVLRYRRQPAMARLLRGDAARRHHALCDAAADRMGALRPRALQSEGACRRAPGRARRHAARCRHRSRSSSRCCCETCAESLTVDESEQGCSWNSGRPASFADKPSGSPNTSAPSRPNSRTTPRWSTTTMSSSSSAARSRHQSRDRDRPLPHRSRGLRQHAGAARHRRTDRGRRAAARSASSMPSSQNQGDAWTVTAAYLDRFVEEQRLLAAATRRESEEQVAYLRYMPQTGRRVAELHLALASNDELPDFAPEPITREDVQRWIGDILARAERVFDALRQRRDTLKEADRPLADQLLAQQCGPARPPERAAAARHRRAQDPPSRRFPSRPDADRQGRRLHHRFRRRAAPHARRAPAQGAGGARRRRPDPLDRLFGDRGARARAQGGAR